VKTCAREHQRAILPKSRHFTVVGKSTVKTVADVGMDMLPITTSLLELLVVSTSITLKDPELKK